MGPAGMVMPPPARRAGSATSGSVSSTASTRRQPAMAVCAWSSTSVATCTGPTNNVTRNRNATSWPEVSPPPRPISTPTTTTAEVAAAANSSPEVNMNAPSRAAAKAVSKWRSTVPGDARVGALLDAVGPDDRRSHDALRDRGEHLADAKAHTVVSQGQAPLEPAQHQQDGGEGQHHHQGQLPAVERHD